MTLDAVGAVVSAARCPVCAAGSDKLTTLPENDELYERIGCISCNTWFTEEREKPLTAERTAAMQAASFSFSKLRGRSLNLPAPAVSVSRSELRSKLRTRALTQFRGAVAQADESTVRLPKPSPKVMTEADVLAAYVAASSDEPSEEAQTLREDVTRRSRADEPGHWMVPGGTVVEVLKVAVLAPPPKIAAKPHEVAKHSLSRWRRGSSPILFADETKTMGAQLKLPEGIQWMGWGKRTHLFKVDSDGGFTQRVWTPSPYPKGKEPAGPPKEVNPADFTAYGIPYWTACQRCVQVFRQIARPSSRQVAKEKGSG